MDLREFESKRILILGLGREGLDSLRFFLEYAPGARLGVADRREADKLDQEALSLLESHPEIELFCGSNYLSAIRRYDTAVKSPGVPIHLPEIEAAYAAGRITSQTEIFFNFCPGTIIGVTGTKGKSTTSSIIHAILCQAGMNAFLLGNIGQPVLGYLANAATNDYFVYELSAHQLYQLKKSPHIAIITNIYQEHLDYYKDFNEYIRAKANIAIYQKKDDFLIYNSSDPIIASIAQQSLAKKIAFNEYDWNFQGTTSLIGSFNLENAKKAAVAARILGISDKTIDEAISNFTTLEHRLEFVGTFRGAKFYNDSLSTIQESAVEAIFGLGDGVQTLIAGGFDRGQPFDKLARAILANRIETLILFPTTGEKIWEAVQNSGQEELYADALAKIEHYPVEDMKEAVKIALGRTGRGKICLMSAASASFNLFRDYAQRGELYRRFLQELS